MKCRTIVVFLALVPAACTTVPKDAGFGDVQRAVGDRTGRLIQWNGRTADDAEVAAMVRGLLAQPLTCDQAVQIALLNNRHLQGSFEDLGVAQADLVQAGLLKNPVFSLQVRVPERSPARTYLDIAVVEDFLDVALLPARKALAEDQFEQAKAEVTDQALTLAADTSAAFYAYQAAVTIADLHRQIAQAAAAGLDTARGMHDAGNMTDLDYVMERAREARMRIELGDAQAEVDEAREKLTDLMGLDGSTEWSVTPTLGDVPDQDPALDGLESLAARQRLDVVVAQKEVQIEAKSLGMTEDFRLVQDLDLGAEGERETDGQWRIGPSISVPAPIFDQGQAAVAGAKAKLRRSEERLAGLEVDVRSQVRAAVERLIHARAKASIYRGEIIPAQEEVNRQMQLQYNGMLTGVFQLLEAHEEQVEAQRQYVESVRDYWTARVELERAIGGRLSTATTSPSVGDRP
ncbi:MAG: TolC family protein [Tepidisphaeraceae bacterium]